MSRASIVQDNVQGGWGANENPFVSESSKPKYFIWLIAANAVKSKCEQLPRNYARSALCDSSR